MLGKIEQWIDQTNAVHKKQRHCCDRFADNFKGYYSELFLKQAYFVVINKIPKIDFAELRELGFGGFIDMEVNGVTYKNTYYVRPNDVYNLRLHFHELVHVVQWNELGTKNFITRYMSEIQNHGYNDTPLDKMAYALDSRFSNNGTVIDVLSYVSEQL